MSSVSRSGSKLYQIEGIEWQFLLSWAFLKDMPWLLLIGFSNSFVPFWMCVMGVFRNRLWGQTLLLLHRVSPARVQRFHLSLTLSGRGHSSRSQSHKGQIDSDLHKGLLPLLQKSLFTHSKDDQPENCVKWQKRTGRWAQVFPENRLKDGEKGTILFTFIKHFSLSFSHFSFISTRVVYFRPKVGTAANFALFPP